MEPNARFSKRTLHMDIDPYLQSDVILRPTVDGILNYACDLERLPSMISNTMIFY